MKRLGSIPSAVFLAWLVFFASRPMHLFAVTPQDVSQAYRQLKTLAQDRSFDVQIARSRASQATAARYTAWSRWGPRLDLELSRFRSRDFSVITSGAIGLVGFEINPQAVDLTRWDLALTLPIYRRSVHVGLDVAIDEKRLAEERLDVALIELDWRLRSLVGNYLLQSYAEATTHSSLATARTNLKEARLRFELGQRTRVDVLRAEAKLQRLESDSLASQQQKTSELDRLLEFSGLTKEEFSQTGFPMLLESETAIFDAIDRLSATGAVLDRLSPYLHDGDSTGRKVAASSPAYGALLSQEEVETSRAGNLMAEQWPELLLRGSVGKQTPDWDFSSDQRSYSIALVLNIPIFSSGSLFSSHYEKVRARQTARLEAERSTMRFLNDVQNQRSRIRSLLSMHEAQKINLAQNEEIVRLSFKSYQLGKTTTFELLTSQDDLLASKLSLARTKLELSAVAREFASKIGVEVP